MASKKPKTIEVKEGDRGQTICPVCGKDMIGVEYSYDSPERYDGISEWVCVDGKVLGNYAGDGCGLRVGRWSHKILKGKDIEYRFGGKP
jgi:hypothetical protein